MAKSYSALIDEWKEVAEKIGLEGKDLFDFLKVKEAQYAIDIKEKEKLERDQRAEDRDYDRAMKEMQHRQDMLDKENARLVKEIELAKIKAAQHDGTNGGHNGNHSKARAPKLPSFSEKDDLDSYLQRFERFAECQKWDKADWAVNLSALLTGKALEVYSRLSVEDAKDFEKLKEALLKRYQLTEEGFRHKFRESKAETGESPGQYVVRLDNYLTRWMKMGGVPDTYDGLRSLVIREQFLSTCNPELATYLKERDCTDLKTMTKLAEKYLEAHGGKLSDKKRTSYEKPHRKADTETREQKDFRKCFNCQRTGHLAKDCKYEPSEPSKMKCYNCGKLGHIARHCKSEKAGGMEMQEAEEVKGCTGCACCKQKNEMAGLCMTKPVTDCIVDGQLKLANGHKMKIVSGSCSNFEQRTDNMPVTEGYVGKTKVETLRDTGCSGVVVKTSLVEESQFTGETVCCILMDSTVRTYPLAQIEIDTPYLTGTVTAMCMREPLYSLVVGNVAGAREPGSPDKGWVKRRRGEKVKGKTETSLGVETRGQSKAKKEGLKPLKVTDQIGENITPGEFRTKQKEDEDLKKCFAKAEKGEEPFQRKHNQYWYEIRDGLLYRIFQCLKPGQRCEVKQLVVPTTLRGQIMKLAHESILAGHMGVKKTLDRIMSNFHWPGIHGDVTRFCRSCDVCQKTIPKGKIGKVPLGQMPLIDEPFKRIAIDLVGPIYPVSEKGNRYILTIVDFATRYPEAIALPGIETTQVAEALLEVYSRMGVPEEVLSDLGTQFTSDLMKEISRLLSIRQLTTTPYHPMCNGLCEKYNGTLKIMLKRLCEERPRDWDRYLCPLLFAYREVPQESLGFSPFELLYGRTVRGPMDILNEMWTGECDSEEVKNSYQYVIDLRNKIEETCHIAQAELAKAQKRYKRYYNKKARCRRFKVGDEVLILLPTDANKLLMQWKGPYEVLEVMSEFNYKIRVRGKVKVYHANLLKQYFHRQRQSQKKAKIETLGATVIECNDPDSIELETADFTSDETYKDVKINEDLSEEQKAELRALIKEFRDIFTDKPGNTRLEQHNIKLTSDEPIRSRPYPIPYNLRQVIKEEVDKMLELGVIEKSDSPYASPVVLVKKPDGSNRFCIDFRKLNRVTVFDAEPMTRSDDIFVKLSKDKYLSKIDMAKGYWQIPVSEDDKQYTAFITHDGLYQFKRMPFGLVNSGATFNRLMRKLLDRLDNIDNYVDDVLAHTIGWKEHLDTLRGTFCRIRDANLTVRPTKCLFGYPTLDYVGQNVGGGEMMPREEKADQIRNADRPKTKRQVRSFLGLTSYYRSYIPDYAQKALPLIELTKKGKPNQVEWSQNEERSFLSLKDSLCSRSILKLPDVNKEFTLQTDASEYAMGAVLLQEHEGNLFPVAFASKKLQPREVNYSVIEKECLALVWAVKKYHIYLYGRSFVLQTDHQPLVYLNSVAHSNSRLMRWSLYLQSYQIRIEAIKGSQNVGADYMSRK